MKANPWIRAACPAVAAAMLSLGATAAGLAPADVDFMKQAALAGDLEVQASTLAQDKASSAPVKDFATTMLKDHRAAADALKQLAARKSVDLPSSQPASEQHKVDTLRGLSGAAFDRAYAQEIGVKAHTEAVALFRKASSGAHDTDVKAFATRTLPTLEHHLDMARSMAASVGKTAQ